MFVNSLVFAPSLSITLTFTICLSSTQQISSSSLNLTSFTLLGHEQNKDRFLATVSHKQAASQVHHGVLVTPLKPREPDRHCPHFSVRCCLLRCYKSIPLNPVYNIQWLSIPDSSTFLHKTVTKAQKPHGLVCHTAATTLTASFFLSRLLFLCLG